MYSFASSKSFHSSGQSTRRRKVMGLRPKPLTSPVRESVAKDSKHKRVRKACERCKIKKIKVRTKPLSFDPCSR